MNEQLIITEVTARGMTLDGFTITGGLATLQIHYQGHQHGLQMGVDEDFHDDLVWALDQIVKQHEHPEFEHIETVEEEHAD